MSLSKFIYLLLQAIIKILIESMKVYESSGDLDSDGVPLDSEYGHQSFLLALLRDCVSDYFKACCVEKESNI